MRTEAGFARIQSTGGGTEQIFYRRRPPLREGLQPLVLIHGAGYTSLLFQPLFNCLPEEVDAWAFDLPGHGRSEGPHRSSIGEYAEALADACGSLGIGDPMVGGVSMGGAVALEAGLRWSAPPWGLVLVSTGARLRVSPAILAAQKEAVEAEAGGETARDPVFGGSTRPADPESHVTAAVRYSDWTCCDRFDVMQEIQQIRVPTLVLSGEADVNTPPKFARYLAETIPGARLRLYPEMGHEMIVVRPEVLVEDLVSFLKEVE